MFLHAVGTQFFDQYRSVYFNTSFGEHAFRMASRKLCINQGKNESHKGIVPILASYWSA